jgi:cyanate permease
MKSGIGFLLACVGLAALLGVCVHEVAIHNHVWAIVLVAVVVLLVGAGILGQQQKDKEHDG